MPSRLPNYVSLDAHSQWHVSALLSTAMESMTLPSRLKVQGRSLQTLDQFENALNINGNQNIAKLRMSIEQKPETNGDHQPGALDIRAQSGDKRLPSQERRADEYRADEKDLTILDMDFFPADDLQQSRGHRSSKKTHVFGQAENYRGLEDIEDHAAEGEDEGHIRARQRAAGLPLVHK